jgi:hypothetical protein
MIQAIKFLGENGPSSKENLFDFLKGFVDKEKLEKKKKLEGSTDDVLFNLKVLQFVKEKDEKVALTPQVIHSLIRLYSGQQIYLAYTRHDMTNVFDMIQTNSLFFSPEIRDIKRGYEADKNTIRHYFTKRTVFNHTFNSFTIDTSLTQLERLEITRKKSLENGKTSGIVYNLEKFHPLIFTQLLIEEYLALKSDDLTVHKPAIQEHFSLKYNINYKEFDDQFLFLKTTLIPALVIPGSYEKFSLNMEVAKELNLYE